jgi:hypothetical protein
MCVGLIPIHIDTLGLRLSMSPATITSIVCGLDSHPYRYLGITSIYATSYHHL